MFQFQVPKILFGIGSSGQIGEECKKLRARKALIVTDKGIVKAGLLDGVKSSLAAAGVEAIVFDEVVPNPRHEGAKIGSDIYKREKCDIIIGFGGGSSLDTAKGAALLATNEGTLLDYDDATGGKKATSSPARYIAIPTTAGTGSEVSNVAVISDEKAKRKFGIHQPELFAVVAIVDPKLTVAMPKKGTAYTGADALSHAVEAYYSTVASPISDIFALRALGLIGDNLRAAFANGENLAARSNMMLASTLAGVAIGQAGIGIDHAIAQTVGGMYDLPHGLLCGLLLPHAMEFNLIANPPKFRNMARALDLPTAGLSDMEAGKLAVAAVRKIVADIEVPSRLSELGVEREKFQKIAVEATRNQMILDWNPRKASQKEVLEILERSF